MLLVYYEHGYFVELFCWWVFELLVYLCLGFRRFTCCICVFRLLFVLCLIVFYVKLGVFGFICCCTCLAFT